MSPGFLAVLLHRQYGEKEQYEDGQAGEEDDDLDDTEKNGITGRDASIATHIENILKRKYSEALAGAARAGPRAGVPPNRLVPSCAGG